MKKIIFALAIVLTMGLTAGAQYAGGRDGFFNDWNDVSNGLDRTEGPEMPLLPGSHGLMDDFSAPLGSGLIILGALGAGYAVAKRKREE